jgi:alpha-L-rhamnosidase
MTVRQMEVLSGGKNVALMKSTREYGTDWSHGHAPFLVDGMPSREEGADCPAGACPSTAAPMFRKSFSVQKNVRRAMVYVAALGMADVTLNGHRVGNDVLGPPFTDYTKAVMYSAYDITGSLKPGDNAFGVVLGNGFFSTPSLGFGQRQNGFGPPRFLLQAVIDYDDGSRQWVTSDPSWTWARSEIVFNDVWWGYAEDRHLARQGWDCPGYDGDGWQKAALAAAPAGKLVARSGPPNRIDGILRPVRVQGNHAYFPVVSAGWPLLKVNGRAGQTITLSGDGPGYSMPHISFVLAKDGPDTLSPRFVILPGPMDMTVDGLDDRLSIDDICIQEVHADLEQTGTFACANPYLDTLFQVAMRTHRNYVNDIPADPNREKQGWTQDVQNMFTTAAYFTDVRDLYERWWRDMRDNQDAQGYLGSVVPMMNRQVYDWNSPWWSGMIVFLPWEHYLFYGNREILETAFPAMARYVDFLASMAATGEGRGWDDYPYFTHNLDTAAARTGMLIWNGAGDWNNPYNATQHAVPTPMTTMPAWYAYARIVSKTAALLGKEQEARTYAKMAETVRQRFNRAYFHPATGLYGDSVNSETAQVLPLAVGMVPDQKVDGTLARLVDAIHAHGDHIGTGFVGTSFLLGELAGYGLSGLANRMVNQQDYPGWKTLTKGGVFMEQWNGGGAQMPSCGGAVGAWLFQSALGIRPLAEHPGFKEFILAPQPDPATGLTWARGSYRTGYGRVSVAWTYDKGRFVLDVDVPANTTAWVYLPAAGQGPDRAATAARRIGSGKYHFDVPLLNASRP